MSFSYYDKDNNIKRLNIEVGKEWSSYKEKDEDSLINSIFDAADMNSDGIVDENELEILKELLKSTHSTKMPTQDGVEYWSEGINRHITKIQLADGNTDDLKIFMKKVGEEQGFIIEFIPLEIYNVWIEDDAIELANKKLLIPMHSNELSEEQELQIIDENETVSENQIQKTAEIGTVQNYSAYVPESEIFLEGGNVLNTLTKNGAPGAIIGDESVEDTMMSMGLDDSEESREIAKKQIAKELELDEKNVTYIPQFDFHIDMYYRPLNNGQIGVPDFEAGIKVIENLKLKTNEQKQIYQDLLQQLKKMESETKIIRENAENELKNQGYELLKIPCFSTNKEKNENPINFMNGVCGTSAKTGDKFYITNTSGDKTLDNYMEKYLKKEVGFDKVYFAPTKEYLKNLGGIDCITKEF